MTPEERALEACCKAHKLDSQEHWMVPYIAAEIRAALKERDLEWLLTLKPRLEDSELPSILERCAKPKMVRNLIREERELDRDAERERCAQVLDGFKSYIAESPGPEHGGFKDPEKLVDVLSRIAAAIRGLE